MAVVITVEEAGGEGVQSAPWSPLLASAVRSCTYSLQAIIILAMMIGINQDVSYRLRASLRAVMARCPEQIDLYTRWRIGGRRRGGAHKTTFF